MVVGLNRWQRVWVVLCGFYLIVVASMLYIFWPTPEHTWHRADFIAGMPPDLRKLVVAAYANEYERQQDKKERRDRANKKAVKISDLDALDSAIHSFPNGALLVVSADADRAAQQRVAEAYLAAVEARTRAKRQTMVMTLAMAWLLPCGARYALGWFARVRRGFRENRERCR